MESYGRPSAGPPPPAVFRDGKRGVRVVEREYLGDIRSGTLAGGSTVFTNQSFVINPGLSTSFPWLSKIARQFDQWEPHGIVFEFRSTSSEFNGTTQALGTIILATDYDVIDSPYPNKVVAENSDYAMSVKASDCAIHGIECLPSERPTPILFTRTAGLPAATDARLYDLGNFQLCTQGMSAADVTLGELWVSYDITFYKKQIDELEPVEDNGLVLATSSNEFTTDDWFGAGGDLLTWGNVDNSHYLDTANRYYLPPAHAGDQFIFVVCFEGSGLTEPTYTVTGGSVIVGDSFAVGSTALVSSSFGGELNASSTKILHAFPIQKTGADLSPTYITASGGALTTGTKVRTYLYQVKTGALPLSQQPVI